MQILVFSQAFLGDFIPTAIHAIIKPLISPAKPSDFAPGYGERKKI